MIHSILNSMPLFFGNIRGTQLLIIVLVILLLFGGRKIPELMKGIGKGVRSFKEGINNIEKDIEGAGTPEENKK